MTVNQIGDDAAAAIADGVCRNTSLRDLNLASNRLGNDFAKCLPLYESLAVSSSLRSIDFSCKFYCFGFGLLTLLFHC